MKSPLRLSWWQEPEQLSIYLPHFPEDVKEVCSPFLGGGSIELALAEQGVRVYGYDIFQPLIWFWRTLTGNPEALADEADSLRKPHPDYENGRGLLKEDFINIREDLRNQQHTIHFKTQPSSMLSIAHPFQVRHLVEAGQKKHLTQGLPTPLLRELGSSKNQNYMLPRLILSNQSQYTQMHFLYLDPPYLLGKDKENLYGASGDTHKGFDHLGLSNLLKERDDWILSYNNCPEILKL